MFGTPDLYAADLLPPILNMFRQAFPLIRVEPRYVLSTPLVNLVKRADVDVALVTRMNDFTDGRGRVVIYMQTVEAAELSIDLTARGSRIFRSVCEFRPVGAISIRFSANRLKSLVEPRGIEPLTS